MKNENFHKYNFITEEKELWSAFLKGDVKALSQIFKSYYPLLFHYGNKISLDEKLTEDCIQDLFFLLWKDRNKLSEVQSLKAYLFKSLRRKILKERICNSRNQKAGGEIAGQEEYIIFSIEDSMIANERRHQQNEEIKLAINKLSDRQKEIIYLRFHKDLSYAEIAEVTDTSINTIRNHIHQSLKLLRNNIFKASEVLAPHKSFK